MNIRYIIFDLDGTLVDTEAQAARAVKNIFTGWGTKVSDEDAAAVAGRKWEVAFEHLFARYPFPGTAESAGEALKGEYRRLLKTEGFAEVPGAARAVKALAADYPLALVSGSDRSEILAALDSLKVRSLFKVILGAEDYPRSKPDPSGFREAVRLLGEDPARGLVFEDSEPGIASARAAGIPVVAISGTNHFGQSQSGAVRVIPDLQGVDPAWVRTL